MSIYCRYTKIGEIRFYLVSENRNDLANKLRCFLDFGSNRPSNKFIWTDSKEFDSTTDAVEFICSNVSQNINVVILDDSIAIADFLKVFQKDTCRPFLYQKINEIDNFSPIICKENNLYLRDSNTFEIENDAYIKNFLKIANRRDIYLSCLTVLVLVSVFVIFMLFIPIVALAIKWLYILGQDVTHIEILFTIWSTVICVGAFVIFLMLSLILYYIISRMQMRAKYAYPKAPCITDETILNNLKNYINKSDCNIQELYKSYQLVMLAVRNFNQQSAHKSFIKNAIKDTNPSTNSIKRILVYTLNALYYKHILSCRIETKKQFEENQILRALYDKLQCNILQIMPAEGKLVFDDTYCAYDQQSIKKWIKTNHTSPITREPLSEDKIQSSEEKFNAILELLRLYDTNLLKPGDKPDASLSPPIEQLILLIDPCIECISQANTVESTSYAYKTALETYEFYDLALLASNGNPIKAKDLLRQKLIAELEVKFNMEIQHEAKKASEDTLKIQTNVQIDVLQANSLKIYGYCLDLYRQNERQMVEFIDGIFSQEQAITTSAKELLIEEFIAIAISSHITNSTEAEIAILKTIIASKEIDKEIFLPQIIKKLIKCKNVDWNYILNVVEKYITSYNAADILYTLYDPDYSACLVLLKTEEEKCIYHFDDKKSEVCLNNVNYTTAVNICISKINETNIDWNTMEQKILTFKDAVMTKMLELQQNIGELQESNQQIGNQKHGTLLTKQLNEKNYVFSQQSNEQIISQKTEYIQ